MAKLPPVRPAPKRSSVIQYEVLPQVGRFIPVLPGLRSKGTAPEQDSKAMFAHDWASMGAKAVILDTASELGSQLMEARTLSKIDDATNVFGSYVKPEWNDYEAVAMDLGRGLRDLYEHQRDLHLILCSHTDTQNESKIVTRNGKPESISAPKAFGFGSIGSKLVTKIEGLFKPCLIHLEHNTTSKKFIAHFRPHQKFRAKWAITGIDPPGGKDSMDVTGPDACFEMWRYLLDNWNGPLRCGIHAESGAGKTTLATSIAELLDGPVVLIGYDPGSLSQIGAWPRLLKEGAK